MIFKYYKENWVLSQVKSLLEKKNDSKKKQRRFGHINLTLDSKHISLFVKTWKVLSDVAEFYWLTFSSKAVLLPK